MVTPVELEGRLRVRLFEVEPDLAAELEPAVRERFARLTVAARLIDPGELELADELAAEGCFAAILERGLVLHRLRLGVRPTSVLLGAGDVVAAASGEPSAPEEVFHVTQPVRLLLLDDRIAAAARVIPSLAALLQQRMVTRQRRLMLQMAISQLPRVEDRVQSLLWMLADDWGRVTSAGRLLPLELTHAMIGELIGAQRPTVSLALAQLTQSGAVQRVDRGWLLHRRPEPGGGPGDAAAAPHIILDGGAQQTVLGDLASAARPLPAPTRAEALRDVVAELERRHRSAAVRFRAAVADARAARRRNAALRGLDEPEVLSPPAAPSSE